MSSTGEKLRLTQFSPGAGCGCKIAPAALEEILKGSKSSLSFPDLLVGNEYKDDAAVYEIHGGKAVISTTDFFTPIVDDPYDFGRISATNAISDIYAMGGTPLMAIAILGWPLEKLGTDLAAKVVEGARFVCDNAGIPLAGGHSISIADPIFGLAVTGIADAGRIKKNCGAKEGDTLFLTKPIGVGLVTTAGKFGLASEEDTELAIKLMTTLNIAGEKLASVNGVNALTDVTGFGLLGHCIEMAEGSSLEAIIEYSKVPLIPGAEYYAEREAVPGGTYRNFTSYGHKVSSITEKQKLILCDPQTSGGLLVSVSAEAIEEVKELSASEGFPLFEIGRMERVRTKGVYVSVN
jgi:selenide,water dikinase